MKNKCTTFEDHLTKQYGKLGTPKRNVFEIKAKSFVIGELLNDERLDIKLTHE